MKSCQSCWSVNTWQCRLNNEILCCRLRSWVNSIIALKNCVKSNDMIVRCVDSQYRRCYLILIDFICDYEKQVIIIDIKSDQHCIICQVSSKERKNLDDKWSLRTHETTQSQIRRQRLENIVKTNDKWVHDVECFVWKHDLVNIHEIMMIDIFHQLLKNMMMHVITWVKIILKAEMSISRKRKDVLVTTQNLSKLNRLNARFKKISSFTSLRIFIRFFDVKQWTKIEQKVVFRQIIFVVTFLLIDKWSHALNFIRALIDFILMIQYRSHDESILQYLQHAIYRMNVFKSIFVSARSSNKKTEKEHFNFFKFHVMTHYAAFIRKYKTADEYDIAHDEVRHKYMLKEYYIRINKRDTFLTQLIFHNDRRLKILIMKNVIIYKQKQQRSLSKFDIVFINTRLTRDSLKLVLLDEQNKSHVRRWDSIMNSKYWCWIIDFVVMLKISDLISILIAFVKK
jgi:hypothetical protein